MFGCESVRVSHASMVRFFFFSVEKVVPLVHSLSLSLSLSLSQHAYPVSQLYLLFTALGFLLSIFPSPLRAGWFVCHSKRSKYYIKERKKKKPRIASMNCTSVFFLATLSLSLSLSLSLLCFVSVVQYQYLRFSVLLRVSCCVCSVGRSRGGVS